VNIKYRRESGYGCFGQPNLEATYRDLVDRLEDIPERHIPRARAALQRLVGGIRLVPEGEHLTAEFTLDGAQLLDREGSKLW
jgi:hypothetical protein